MCIHRRLFCSEDCAGRHREAPWPKHSTIMRRMLHMYKIVYDHI